MASEVSSWPVLIDAVFDEGGFARSSETENGDKDIINTEII